MKRLLLLLFGVLIAVILQAQQLKNELTYPLWLGKVGVSNGQLIFKGSTSGTVTLKPNEIAGTGTIFQFPANNGTSGYVLRTDGNGILTWVAQTGGIGAADTALMLNKYARKLNSTLTGTTTIAALTLVATPITTTPAQLNYLNTSTSNIQTQLNNTIALPDVFVLKADSSDGTLGKKKYATSDDVLKAGAVSFTVQFDPSTLNPTDNTTYYYGCMYSVGQGTSGALHQYIIPFNCTLVGYSLVTRSTAAASNETSTVYARINDATDVLLSNAVTFAVGGAYKPNYFSSGALNTDLTAGDKIEIKWISATWATDATAIFMPTILFFKNR